jgi:hypothetical protein
MVRVLAIGPGFTGSNLIQVIDITVNTNIKNCWYSQWQIQKNVMGGQNYFYLSHILNFYIPIKEKDLYINMEQC